MGKSAVVSKDHTPNGKFAPGNSAAPTSRLKKAPRSLLLECTSEEQVRRLIQNAFNAAENGDAVWSAWLLNRVVPPLRSTAPRFEFDLDTDDPVQAAKDILAATADGRLSTDQSKDLLSSLASLNELIEINDLKSQIEDLRDLLVKK